MFISILVNLFNILVNREHMKAKIIIADFHILTLYFITCHSGKQNKLYKVEWDLQI